MFSGAFAYVEFGLMNQKSGSHYAYLQQSLGNPLAFLYTWVATLVLRPSTCAILSLLTAEYLMAPLFDDGCGRTDEYLIRMAALFFICKLYISSRFVINS